VTLFFCYSPNFQCLIGSPEIYGGDVKKLGKNSF
jgi:hypothetical protein